MSKTSFDRARKVHAGSWVGRHYAWLIAAGVMVLAVVGLIVAAVFVRFSHVGQVLQGQSHGVSSVFDRFEVSGRVGATPVLNLKAPVSVVGAKDRVVLQGHGRTIDANSPLVVAITAFDGRSGELLNPSRQAKLQVGYADERHFAADFLDVVVGQAEGSRILVVRHLSPDALASGATSDVEINVIDILSSIATGEELSANNGVPLMVDIGEAGPRVTHGQVLPSGLTTQLLVKGEGPQVQPDSKVIAQYSLANWGDGIVRQSTWNNGIPELIDLSTAMPGLVQALADQRVGSRVAVTIPPDLALGDDTVVAVVDILAATYSGAAGGQH